eukprot:a513349_11.p2 GENE.a513349_11~~a513349_11.p2  ORF type:complete len:554 (-),score=205.59 a513349_11:27-1649(-)
MIGHRTRALVLAALVALATAAHGYTQEQMTKSWLVSTTKRHFCAAMVQPITMEQVAPQHFNPPCKPGDYSSKIAAAVVGPLLMAILTVVALLLFCVGRFCLNQCGGAGPFRVFFHEEEREIALAQQYSRRSRVALVFVLACAAFVVAMGSGWMLVASSTLHVFTYDAANIFNTQSQYLATTAGNVIDQASMLAPLDENALAATLSFLSSFASKTATFTASLHTLDSLRTTFVVVTACAAVLVCLLGLGAAFAGCHRFSLGLGVLAFGVIACLWVHVLIPQAAANVFYDLCGVINGCHYCVESGAAFCPLCKVNFFQALSECSPSAANAFAPLATALDNGTNARAATALAAVTNLCATVACVGGIPLSNADVVSTGLSGWLVSTSGGVPNYVPVSTLANSSYPGAAAAFDVLQAMAPIEQYAALADSLETLNCSAPTAYVESVDPEGTFDALQKHLCPLTTYPQNPPQVIFSQLALAALFTLLGMHVALVVLILGHKRFRAVDGAQGGLDQSAWLLRPSAYRAYGALPGGGSGPRDEHSTN